MSKSKKTLIKGRVSMTATKEEHNQVPVAHTYNLNYSGGRDQEDHGSKTVQANSSRDPVSKNPLKKKSGSR
jgi:hypothetical protein